MTKNRAWISLPVFLSLGLLKTLAEKPLFGSARILLGATLGFSKILYESGAISALILKDKIPVAFPMFGYTGNLEEFTRNFGENIKRRLSTSLEEPTSFSSFIGNTDLRIYGISVKAKDLLYKKIPVGEALELLVSSWCEGVVFGMQFAELALHMVVREYERDKTVTWDNRELINKLTLLGDPRATIPTLQEKEEEVSELIHSYAEKYFPDLVCDLGLSGF